MNRLSYRRKFGLISLLFIAPLTLVLILFVFSANDRITFAQKEIDGAACLRPSSLRAEWTQAQEESARARAAEGALRENEEHTRLILENALDGVITMDMSGRITGWNTQAEIIFGWPREEACGQTLAEMIVPPHYREAHARGLKHFLATGAGPVLNQRIEITALDR